MTTPAYMEEKSKLLHSSPPKVHLVRFHMYKEIEKVLKKIKPSGTGYTIADWKPVLHSFMPEVAFHNLEYPQFDIQNLHQIASNSSDAFYSEMILEHIVDPQAAIDESHRILKKGGVAIHTTVFMMPYHPSPIDLMRFSPDLLERMCQKFSHVYVGGTGNWRTFLLVLCRMTRLSVFYPKGGIIPWLLKGNNPKYPVCTWVVAQK